MLSHEKRINNSALRRDIEGLKHALMTYKALMLTMVREFLSTNGNTENLFVEREISINWGEKASQKANMKP